LAEVLPKCDIQNPTSLLTSTPLARYSIFKTMPSTENASSENTEFESCCGLSKIGADYGRTHYRLKTPVSPHKLLATLLGMNGIFFGPVFPGRIRSAA